MTSWNVKKDGASHGITVTAAGVSTSEVPLKGGGPTFGSNYGLSEVLRGKNMLTFRARFGDKIYEAVLAAVRAELDAWQPPVVTATRESCPVCATLSGYLSADLREGKSLPLTGFVDVASVFSGALRRCPHCATYYEFHNDFEFGYEDTDTLKRLSPDEAAEFLEPLNHLEAAWARSRCG